MKYLGFLKNAGDYQHSGKKGRKKYKDYIGNEGVYQYKVKKGTMQNVKVLVAESDYQ